MTSSPEEQPESLLNKAYAKAFAGFGGAQQQSVSHPAASAGQALTVPAVVPLSAEEEENLLSVPEYAWSDILRGPNRPWSYADWDPHFSLWRFRLREFRRDQLLAKKRQQ